MGCGNSSRKKEENIEDSLITKVVDSLNITNKSSVDLANKFHRYSTRLLISLDQFNKISKELQLETKKFDNFYSFFIDQSGQDLDQIRYDTRKLACLGIICGLSEVKEKIRLLFQNYDVDASRLLNKRELKIMVKDIVFIHFKAVPGYVFSLYPENKNLKDYAFKLSLMEDIVSKIFYSALIDDKQIITYAQFYVEFSSVNVLKLLDGKALRQEFYEKFEDFKEKISKMTEETNKTTSSPKSPSKKYSVRSKTMDFRTNY